MKTVKNFLDFINESIDEGVTSDVWYVKNKYFRDYILGSDNLPDGVELPDPNNLEATHAFIGKFDTLDLDIIYNKMQGEFWSEGKTTNDILKSKDVGHTSMSVGDIIRNKDGMFMVDNMGFYDLEK
jgi:hypothetical protein